MQQKGNDMNPFVLDLLDPLYSSNRFIPRSPYSVLLRPTIPSFPARCSSSSRPSQEVPLIYFPLGPYHLFHQSLISLFIFPITSFVGSHTAFLVLLLTSFALAFAGCGTQKVTKVMRKSMTRSVMEDLEGLEGGFGASLGGGGAGDGAGAEATEEGAVLLSLEKAPELDL